MVGWLLTNIIVLCFHRFIVTCIITHHKIVTSTIQFAIISDHMVHIHTDTHQTHVHTRTYTHTHKHIYIHTHTHTQAQTHTHTSTYTHKYTHTHTHTHTRTHTDTQTHTDRQTDRQTDTHSLTHKHKHRHASILVEHAIWLTKLMPFLRIIFNWLDANAIPFLSALHPAQFCLSSSRLMSRFAESGCSKLSSFSNCFLTFQVSESCYKEKEHEYK